MAYADSYCRKENKTMLKEGQMVQVVLPLKDTVGAETVADFKGVVTTVKEVKMYRKGRSTTFYSYTLHGCQSEYGIDLEFCEDWLVPLDDEV